MYNDICESISLNNHDLPKNNSSQYPEQIVPEKWKETNESKMFSVQILTYLCLQQFITDCKCKRQTIND